MKLPSEERNRSFKIGRDDPRSAMSQVLRRYFTPSSAALAQATLQRMHSSGDLQGSGHAADLMTQLEDSVDLDDKPSTAEQLQPVESQHMGASSTLGISSGTPCVQCCSQPFTCCMFRLASYSSA